MCPPSDPDVPLDGATPHTEAQDDAAARAATSSDPLRPSDHIDGDGDNTVPSGNGRLGVIGWLRWFWRQLTSMRIAILLLLLLAIAAVPGSLFSQNSSDPNGVIDYRNAHPTLYPILKAMGMFDVYSSGWFSAIYILLFISLIGCVLPRTKHHWQALRAQPPRTPVRLQRLVGYQTRVVSADESGEPIDPEVAIAEAATVLKRGRYRVQRYDDGERLTVSAERGYLRETGNLVFHGALVCVLLTVAIGGGLSYSGQRLLVEKQTFVNSLVGYDSFNPGRWFSETSLQGYGLTLNKLAVTYETQNLNALGQAIDYNASVTTREPDGTTAKKTVKVNEPLTVDGDQIYLLGNGYAPTVTVRDPNGKVVFTDSVPFLPQDTNLTSLGVIKVPDGLAKQVGMTGFFYPTKAKQTSGVATSTYPDLLNPVLDLNVYTGNLGLDKGDPVSVYALDTDKLTEIAGINANTKALSIPMGKTRQLPDGLGSVTFSAAPRYVSFDIHHVPNHYWLLAFASLLVLGLITSLLVPRRRVWVTVTRSSDGSVALEYAGLARGDDPRLDASVAALATEHRRRLGIAADASADTDSVDPDRGPDPKVESTP